MKSLRDLMGYLEQKDRSKEQINGMVKREDTREEFDTGVPLYGASVMGAFHEQLRQNALRMGALHEQQKQHYYQRSLRDAWTKGEL